jgi:hypothetical protein
VALVTAVTQGLCRRMELEVEGNNAIDNKNNATTLPHTRATNRAIAAAAVHCRLLLGFTAAATDSANALEIGR